MKNKTAKSVISLIILVATLICMLPSTNADAAGLYPAGQYYDSSYGTTQVYTVQFSAGKNLSGAEKNRDSMLSYGKDAFVYRFNNSYRIMTGKFRNYSDAECYLRDVKNIKGADDGYITSAILPDYAVAEFESIYFNNCPANNNFGSCNPNPGPGPAQCSKASWSASIPCGFLTIEESADCSIYYEEYYDMSFTVTQEKTCATSAKSKSSILSTEYYNELNSHCNVTYNFLSTNYFEVSGYDGSYIYFARGVITSNMYYFLYFYYPTANRGYCDSALESIRDSFWGY